MRKLHILSKFFYFTGQVHNWEIRHHWTVCCCGLADIFLSEETVDISRHNHWFPREMTSEKREIPYWWRVFNQVWSWVCFWLVESNFPRGTTNQKLYPDLDSDTYGISALVPQTPFRGETSSGVTKCGLFPPGMSSWTLICKTVEKGPWDLMFNEL